MTKYGGAIAACGLAAGMICRRRSPFYFTRVAFSHRFRDVPNHGAQSRLGSPFARLDRAKTI